MDFQSDFEQFNKTYPLQCKQVNGLTFHYRLGGSGEKVIVLLVGGLAISDAFHNHFISFAKSFTVLTFDYPAETCRNSILADGIAGIVSNIGFNKYSCWQSMEGLLPRSLQRDIRKRWQV